MMGKVLLLCSKSRVKTRPITNFAISAFNHPFSVKHQRGLQANFGEYFNPLSIFENICKFVHYSSVNTSSDNRLIQWGLEYRTHLDFGWSKDVPLVNGSVLE